MSFAAASHRSSVVRRLAPEFALALAMAANLAVVLALTHFPYQDWVNHLARYQLMAQAWAGTAPPQYRFTLIPTPYLGLDLVGAALVSTLGPRVTVRVLALLLTVTLPLGSYLLLRAVAPEQRGWALVGALLSFNAYYLVGNVSYLAGVGILLGWLAWWWPRRERPGPLAILALGAGLGLSTLVHLSVPMMVLVVLWIDAALYLWHSPSRRPLGAHGGRLLLPGVGVLVVGGMLVWIAWAGPNAESGALPTTYRPLADKFRQLAYPFYGLSHLQLGLLLVGYGASVGAFAMGRGLTPRDVLRSTWGVASLGFLVLYFITPTSIQAAGAIDVRWLLPALLLPLAVRPARPLVGRDLLLAIPLLASLAHAGLVWQEHRYIEPRLADFDRVLAAVPAGSELFPVVANPRTSNPVNPFRYYALWLLIDGRARVPGLFSLAPTCDGCPLTTHMAHFREIGELYFPSEEWVVPPFTPIRWDRVHREYDYMVQAGEDARLREVLLGHGREVERAGEVTLYRLVPPR